MKTFILSAFAAIVFLSSCESTKNMDGTNTSTASTALNDLNGKWELNYISGPRIAFEGLYPNRKPTIIFDIAAMRVSGNTSCNSYAGAFTGADGNIVLSGPMAVTKMMCVTGALGETTYLEMMKKVNRYSVNDTTLSLMIDEIPMMRFAKRL